MRKALALLLAVAIGSVAAGIAIPSGAVTAGATTLSTAELDNELQAISSSASFSCYLDARDFLQSNGQENGPPFHGASSQAWGTGAVVEWSNIRVTQLLLDDFVASHDPSALSPSSLVAARSALADAITATGTTAVDDAESAGTAYSCQGSASGQATLASLPAWFLDEQVRAEAGTLGLTALVPNPIATSGPGLREWYRANSRDFDTICLSDLVVSSQTKAGTVVSEVDHGLPFATAVDRYSSSAAGRKDHGAIGCYSPTSPDWSSVSQYVGDVPVGRAIDVQGGNGWYVLAPTRRTQNVFGSIQSAVAAEARDLNVQRAQVLATSIQAAAHVSIAPQIGSWVPTSLGGTITAPSAPPPAAVLNASANTSAS